MADGMKSGLKHPYQMSKICKTDVGKQVLCPRCGLPGSWRQKDSTTSPYWKKVLN